MPDSSKAKIYIGSDHGGFELKRELIKFLTQKNYAVEDVGPSIVNLDDDYPDFAIKLCKKVVKDSVRGILVCKSGAGMCIAANKVPGIYAADCWDKEQAFFAKKDEDCNVLCLGTRWVGAKKAKEIVDAWLSTSFEGGRHERRMKKIKDIEKTYYNTGN